MNTLTNKQYCKQKDKCTKTHPLKECDGNCNDKRTCPKRHKVPCKYMNQCEYYASKSCEFLHQERIREEIVIEGVDIQYTINNFFKSVKTIEEKILSRKSIQKYCYKNMFIRISDTETKKLSSR